MKLARAAQRGGTIVSCIWRDTQLVVLPQAISIVDVLAMSPEERNALERSLDQSETLDPSAVRLLPPVVPTSIKDFMGFERHFAGALKYMFPNGGGPGGGSAGSLPPSLYEQPMFYLCDTSNLLGPADDYIMPANSEMMCCEVELAAVMARGGRDMTPEQAGEAIGGYTIFLDWSARDLLVKDGLSPTKGKDAGNTLGPCIATKDEIERFRAGDRLKVPMKLTRNGEHIGEGDTEESIYSIEEMIAYASRSANVLPGDVIALGTSPAMCWVEHWGNNGEVRPSPIKPGDVISVEVAGIGEMSINVKPAAPHVPLPRARSWL